jgi:periplasmic copper chaperone A
MISIKKTFCVLILLMASWPAVAHVVLETKQAAAASNYKAAFRVGHGCSGSPTTTVIVTIPDDVVGIKPQPKPGWALTTTEVDLASPIVLHGRKVARAIRTVTWSGGVLLDAHFDDFVMLMQLPDQIGMRYFPITQICEKGRNEWHQIPDGSAAKLSTPAAALELIKPSAPSAQHVH